MKRERLTTTLEKARVKRAATRLQEAQAVAAETGEPQVQTKRIEPQKGPQHAFLTSTADIAIYGGAAGSGKSFALLLDPLRYATTTAQFSAVIFRRTTTEIRNPGGLWDESLTLYSDVEGAVPTSHVLEWHFGAGLGKVKFAHLEHDNTVMDWHSAQVPLICFDELTTFTYKQFFYMLSRNRSVCGVKPYVRATCNPDADSWVAQFISWWIDQNTGLPIAERSGVLRYFVRIGNDLIWADSREELCDGSNPRLPLFDEDGRKIEYMPLSVTFIGATIDDNKILLEKDPSYLAKLQALPLVERQRLLKGNWKIKPAAGLMFQRSWVQVIDKEQMPPLLSIKRGWDLGASEKTELNDPDPSSGTKIAKTVDGRYVVLHNENFYGGSFKVEQTIRNLASQDGVECEVCLPQDPGQAGKSQVAHLKRMLSGFNVRSSPETGDKVTRFSPFSAAAEAGNVMVLRGAWNEQWFTNLEGFPDMKHDDDADSTARAFNSMHTSSAGIIEYYQLQHRQQDQVEKQKQLDDEDLVFVRPPLGNESNMLQDMKGRYLNRRPDGTFRTTRAHAEALRLSGFTLIEPQEETAQ